MGGAYSGGASRLKERDQNCQRKKFGLCDLIETKRENVGSVQAPASIS